MLGSESANVTLLFSHYSTSVTFKGRVQTRSFEGLIDVSLSTCSQIYQFYFVRSGVQLY